jgi:hypothetical protein
MMGARGSIVRRRAAAIAAAACVASSVAAACGKDPEGPAPVFEGGYRLDAVGGRPLPMLICGPFPPCDTLKAARIEVMSRGRIRDIYVFGMALQNPSTQVDTLVTPYALDGTRIFLDRTAFTGSTVGGQHTDSGHLDAQGRLIVKPHYLRKWPNAQDFLYAPDSPP